MERAADDLQLMLTAELREVHGIAGHADCQLRILLRVLHGILEHLAVKDIHVQVVRTFVK